MILKLKRQWFTDKSSMGLLTVDGIKFSFTLEDAARADGVKIPGKTAIPPGEYRVIIDFSQRFQKKMPHVMDVRMFEGVRIHAGNTSANTEGCILVGYQKSEDMIWDSTKAFDDLFTKMQEAHDRQECISLIITNEPI